MGGWATHGKVVVGEVELERGRGTVCCHGGRDVLEVAVRQREPPRDDRRPASVREPVGEHVHDAIVRKIDCSTKNRARR